MINYFLFLCSCTAILFLADKVSRDSVDIERLKAVNESRANTIIEQEIKINNLTYELGMCKLLYTGKHY